MMELSCRHEGSSHDASEYLHRIRYAVGGRVKENMHHRYDISLKDAFYIKDLNADIFF